MTARDPLEDFARFAAEVRVRLELGRTAYRDESFSRPLSDLMLEIRAELLDVAAWAYIASVRLEAVERAAYAAESALPTRASGPNPEEPKP